MQPFNPVNPNNPKPGRIGRAALFFAGLFAFLGFADAAYLTADHYIALPLPCSLTGGCEVVLNSAYATVGPIPLATIGAAYYLLALFLVVYIYTNAADRSVAGAVRAVWALSIAGVLASVFYVYVQIFVLQALCMYCLGSAFTSVLLFTSTSVLLRQERKQQQNPL